MNKISKLGTLVMLAMLWVYAPSSVAAVGLSCDVNLNQIVDKTDISLITAAVGKPSSGAGDPRDVDNDGKITAIDSRTCVNQCTLPKCATPVAAPNVVGKTQAAAQTAITTAGLVLGTVTSQSSSTVLAGNVISQNPVAGTSVAAGTAIALFISSGPAPVNAPNVVGLTQAAAASAITGVGLKVGTVTQQSSATVALGNVISQNPVAGTSVAAGSAIALVISSGPAPVNAPNVVGLTQAAATSAITGVGLKLGTVTQQSSSTVALGNVISQNPTAGTSVAAGSAIALVISSGPAPVNAPNVVGLTQAAATTAITGAGLTLGTVTQQSSATVALGNVISQNPTAGTSVAAGSAIALVISSGPAPVNAPNVVGLTQAAATTAITGAGLTLGTVTQQSSGSVALGNVISQNPVAGTSVAAGSAIALVISSGPAPVNAPNVVGLTQAAATTAISGVGLKVGTVTQQSSATVALGNVISQNPTAGTSVAAGSAIALVISSGPAPVNAPNVVGLTQAAATTAITGVGLKVGTVTQQSSATVALGNVISQNPTAGTSVAAGSAIALVISSGPAPVNAPNVVGLTQAAATTAITGVGLKVGTVTQQSSGSVALGNVISQNPIAGTSVAAGSAIALVISSGPAPVNAPNVVGLTQAAATSAITGAGLTVGTVTQQSSATVALGNVISQNPTAGTSVAAGSAIALVISSGPAPVNAPNVVGLTQAAATTAITGVGLKVGTVTQQSSATVALGNVISQNPTAGTSVAAGSAIALVISSGPAPVNAPNVVGLTQAAATTAITGVGLKVGTVTQQSSGSVALGNVISQNPTAGTSVAAGSAIALVISSGPAPVNAPNVVGLTQAAATTAITGVGLKVGTVTQQSSGSVALGNVISQNPVAGTSVAAGSAIALVISSGPAPVNAPNVVGLTQAAATTAITGAGLTVGTVTQQSSSTVSSGRVISQSPLAGTSVAAGSVVNLVVSSGSGVAAPSSINLTPSQFIIGAGSSITIAAEVLDNGGNAIVPTPIVDYQILANPATAQGTAPTINGNQINTSLDTRGSFTIEGVVASTSVTKQFVLNVIQNGTQSKNSGNLVTLAAAQTSVVRNIAVITAAMQGGNLADIPAATAALTAAANSLSVNGLAQGTVYEPDTGFVPSAAQLAAHYPATAADNNYGSITTQLRTKLQQITQLLAQPSGNDANDTTLLSQYATELQALWDQSQLSQNRPTVNGLVKNDAATNNLLVQDIPAVLLTIINRVNTQVQSSGAVALQGNSLNMYALTSQSTPLPTAMYTTTRPVFLLTGLLGYAGNIGGLITRIYGDYLDQVQKMYILLAAQGLLNQFLDQFITVGGLITGGSQSFHAYHMPDSVIYTGGLSTADALSADVFLIGGAAINRVSSLIGTLRSAGGIRTIRQLYDFYNSMLSELQGAGEDYNTAHQQPNSAQASSFDNGGCLLSSVDPCVELYYDSGFNYVGSGGPIALEPVIILVKTNNPRGSEFGSAIFNFAGK